ncbi:uncharacterized protein MYU51_001541 [Penicillium brevicompactum]|uniref:uncharacterized protein n=1 Tax=Penicillium brevicompactum TaxID=5074 RepID=UPI002540836D|nr:uncharacterized protein N7506_009964 [Penicillium brevicompactum]KAJ5326862.1 hypothetical protein N7506_009964 [Penicillium brevicompactum]
MSTTFGLRAKPSKVAFVTGVNGISGSAIVDHLIKQPHSEWSEIIITSRSPIKSTQIDSRVRFVAIDFLRPVEEIVEQIKDLCKNVTHAFFTSYVHDNDFSILYKKNGPLFRHFLEATDLACPKLKRVVLQTGGKHYAFQYRDIKTPLVEDIPRYTGPENMFYYEQEDDLFAVQKRRNTWNYNIIRPMGIIGFSWQYLGINETLPIAQYFLVCRELGEAPRWPGNLDTWLRSETQSFAPGIADLTIWAATQDACKDEAFNHVNGDVIVWKFLWYMLADYFKAPMTNFEPPTEETKTIDMAEWAKDKRPTWEKIVAKHGGEVNSFNIAAFELMNWYIAPSGIKGSILATNAKARDFGWLRNDDTYRAWLSTMRAYENAGVLPIS